MAITADYDSRGEVDHFLVRRDGWEPGSRQITARSPCHMGVRGGGCSQAQDSRLARGVGATLL